ncbi:hypothetical protein [Streptosporangium sp. NPDC002721]|uniref:hypothetical protein n=1 Tax=Streptosporangium sp. NPDC002721 TaxID=3366188 RepID=UPI0036C869C2
MTALPPDHPECVALARRIAELELTGDAGHRARIDLENMLRPVDAPWATGFGMAADLINAERAEQAARGLRPVPMPWPTSAVTA